jgi:ubiquinone/menaquinone biosynthesis C-methylase UbiE
MLSKLVLVSNADAQCICSTSYPNPGDIYEIIGCGAEELQTKGGIQKESIDTIITVQCLCSIPTPQTIINELYPLLKPGGQWLVFEHIKTKYQTDFVGYWQSTCCPKYMESLR